MWIALDLITAALLIFSVVSGYKKGFIKTAFGLGILVASLIISCSLSGAVSKYVRTTKQYVSFTTAVKENFVQSFEAEEAESDTKDSSENSEPTDDGEKEFSDISETLSKIGIELDFEDINKAYNERVESGVQSAAEALDEVVVQPIAKMLCDALCFVVVFLVSVLVLHILMLLLELVFKLPLLKGMNKFSGALFGVLFGVLKVFAFCTVFQIILPYIKNAEIGITLDIAEKTHIYSFFLDLNPLKFLY